MCKISLVFCLPYFIIMPVLKIDLRHVYVEISSGNVPITLRVKAYDKVEKKTTPVLGSPGVFISICTLYIY